MTAFLRRVRCAIRPGWHPGFISRPMTMPHNFSNYVAGMSGYKPNVYWTRPRCISCGEAEY